MAGMRPGISSRWPVFTGLLGLSLAGSVVAQPAQPAVDDLAAALAYEQCPRWLAGEIALGKDDQLKALGFNGAPETRNHPRLGEIQIVSSISAEWELGFGGAAELTCTVVVQSPASKLVLAKLRSEMGTFEAEFAPDPANSSDRHGVKVEAFKSRLDPSTMLYVQLIDASVSPKPSVMFQMFAMEE